MKVFRAVKAAKVSSSQRGIALLTALLMLLLLSALGVGMMYVTSTDTQINSNFRAEQQAYFAARAGMEELRDRMRAASVNPTGNSIATTPGLPADMPGTSATSVIYLINGTTSTIAPWDSSNQYFDTELCHDGFTNLAGDPSASLADVQCKGSTLSAIATKHTAITSVLPFAGTSAAIPFKWARLTLKQANSVLNHPVDPKNQSNSTLNSAQICWTGSYEEELLSTNLNCNAQNGDTNVYMITALAVTSTGARRMVQSEVAMQPLSSNHYGLFATSTGCGAVTLSGGATTDSYDSTKGSYGNQTPSTTGGSVGSNGNVLLNGGAVIGGNVYSPITPSITGSCPGAPMTINGGSGGLATGDSIVSITSQTPNTPTIPAPGTGTENDQWLKKNASSCSAGGYTGYCLSAGKYGDISISSSTTLILQSGTYNINSISETGQAKVIISPGPVTINVTGTGNNNPVSLSGGGFVNTSVAPSSLQINYAGTGEIDLTGGSSSAMLVNAPNSYVKMSGSGNSLDFYGAVLANTITLSGGAKFHYDTHAQINLPVATYYSLLSYRELYY